MTLPVRRHVLVDVDGVLADFDRGFLHLWRTAHPDRPWLAPAARRHFYLREDYPSAWRRCRVRSLRWRVWANWLRSGSPWLS